MLCVAFKGVFRDVVEWCLVLTTKEEAMVCALAKDTYQTLTIIPTKFVIPSDWVSFLSVTSTKSGRIFLGGQDGNLYELDYDLLLNQHYQNGAQNDAVVTQQKLEDFYDGSNAHGSCPAVLNQGSDYAGLSLFTTGKRILNSISSTYKEPPRKCQKLNHSQSPITSLMPDLVNKMSAVVFGDYTTTGGGPIIQMVVDHERQVLYTLSARGWICALDIAETPKIKLAAVLDTPSTARLFLDYVSRGRSFPPSSSNAKVGIVTFIGGGEAAQAGVGGMEGARYILKLAEADKNARRRAPVNSILTPVSIQVVPNQESTRITLVAITAGGLRYYLSSLAPDILGAGPQSPPFGTSRHRHPWKPNSKLTLCHIRGPPSLKGATYSQPDHNPEVSKDHRVDAACYRLGVFFAAFQNTVQKMPPTTGNIMVVASADYVQRLPEKSKKDPTTIVTYIPPGGICEVTSFPTAMGGAADPSQTPLPGGRVWEICAADLSRGKLWSLALHSKTPTDTELGFSMAPAYLPPVRTKRMLPPSSSNNASALTRSIVPASQNHRSMSSLAFNVFKNIVMSRPVRHGISIQQTTTPDRERSLLYRISKHYGSQGYSLSAADNKSNRGMTSNKSSRLSPWLLCPDVVPLNPLALQHLEPPDTSFMALNAGGMHSFRSPSILQQLSLSVEAAGTNVRADPDVSRFFQDHGHDEGCAMCLMLAIKAAGNNNLKENALRAAMSRAYRPALLPNKNDDGTSVQPQQNHDPWIPSGYSFTSSALCKGLTLVLSRLLRPVWYKPAVVVTEGRILKRGHTSATTPAKVELLMDDETLEEVRRPLFEMQEVMRRVFGKAITSVPLSKSSSFETDKMDVDEEENQYFLTRALEFQRKGQLQTAGDTPMRASDAEGLAQHIEERNIHLMYRLLSRTTQLLSLLSYLRMAHDMSELPEVEWGLLHGIPVAHLVQTKEGHERIEKVLNHLIISDKATGKMSPTPSANSSQLANLLAKECYFFFSPGSRHAYLGFRIAEEAVAMPPGQTRREVRSEEAEKCFMLAAANWNNAALITGTLLHPPSEMESYSDIAMRAEQCGSPLARACSLMVLLGNACAVVKICLKTADNFSSQPQQSYRDMADNVNPESSRYGWEKGLYQQRQDDTKNRQSNGVTASNALVLGTSVNASDAIGTCYALVFYHLSKLLDSSLGSDAYSLGEKMVSSASASPNKEFLHAFYNHLLQQNHQDVLMRIDSEELEEWLTAHSKDQPGLLLKYCENRGKHIKAAEAAWTRATSSNLKLNIHDRIELFVGASNSYTNAMKDGSNSKDILDRKKKEVDERLTVARLQVCVRQRIESTKYELPEHDLDRLQNSLLVAADLFNKYAYPYEMYEICLRLLHVCKQDDIIHIQRLWKSIFCEEVFPCCTRNEKAFHALVKFQEGSILESPFCTLLQNETSSGDPLFEDGRWMKSVEGRVTTLGKDVIGHGADFIFPVEYVLSNLEGKR